MVIYALRNGTSLPDATRSRMRTAVCHGGAQGQRTLSARASASPDEPVVFPMVQLPFRDEMSASEQRVVLLASGAGRRRRDGHVTGEPRGRAPGMSCEGFSRMFARLHGMPPHAFWLMARLNHARIAQGGREHRRRRRGGRLHRPEPPRTVVSARLWRHPGPLPLGLAATAFLILGVALIRA
jgi:hypothetical protein